MRGVWNGDELASLTSAALDGDAQALNTLLTQVRPRVFRYVLARVADTASAEDVTQEVAITIVTALPRYVDTGRPIMAWVFGIAQRKISETRRVVGRRSEFAVDALAEQLCADASSDPEAVALRSETTRHMAAMLAMLPPEQAEILRLRIAAGLSAEETASVVGISAGAVRVAQHRALTKLRAMAVSEVTR